MTAAYDLDRQTRFDQVISRRLPGSANTLYTPIYLPLTTTVTHTHKQPQLSNLPSQPTTILQRTLARRFTTTPPTKMPLVVPGLQSKDGKNDDWMGKLMGKSLGDSHNETVRVGPPLSSPATWTPTRVPCPLFPSPCPCQTTLPGRRRC